MELLLDVMRFLPRCEMMSFVLANLSDLATQQITPGLTPNIVATLLESCWGYHHCLSRYQLRKIAVALMSDKFGTKGRRQALWEADLVGLTLAANNTVLYLCMCHTPEFRAAKDRIKLRLASEEDGVFGKETREGKEKIDGPTK